jgi:hypothetical protein
MELVLARAKLETRDGRHGKKNAKVNGIPQLEDAIHAGSRNAMRCALILADEDSTKIFGHKWTLSSRA